MRKALNGVQGRLAGASLADPPFWRNIPHNWTVSASRHSTKERRCPLGPYSGTAGLQPVCHIAMTTPNESLLLNLAVCLAAALFCG